MTEATKNIFGQTKSPASDPRNFFAISNESQLEVNITKRHNIPKRIIQMGYVDVLD